MYNLQTLNNIINNLELPKSDAEVLRKEPIIKTQKTIADDVKNHLDDIKSAVKYSEKR